MMNFMVTVACAVGVQCGLPHSVTMPYAAYSTKHCIQSIQKVGVEQYGLQKANFVVHCKRIK